MQINWTFRNYLKNKKEKIFTDGGGVNSNNSEIYDRSNVNRDGYS